MTGPPPRPLGLTDFFGLEAGEYLERLDALLGRPDAAAASDEFVRLSRALRGSALMANQQAIARAAAGLESLARAVREGRRALDEGTRQHAIRAVDDLKIFVRRVPEWSDADSAKADALAAQLDDMAGRVAAAQVRAAEAVALDAGARAFVAREGAAIGSALDRAASALRTNPLAHDPLQHVLKALQPLRGLAAVNDLPPLPDLLEGIERGVAELVQSGAPVPTGPALFQAAAAAMAQAARGVAERGKPEPDSAEFQRFAGLLVELLDSEPGIVPISSLYPEDDGPHIVERGAAAAGAPALGRVEIVSHGEHLRQAADSLERAPSATQRELRAHSLGATLRAFESAGGGPLAQQLAEFAATARDAVARGLAAAHAPAFAAELRRAADLLVRSSTEDEAALASRLREVTGALRSVGQPVSPARGAQEQTRRPPAVIEEEELEETPDIAGSWVAYERMRSSGAGPAALDELLTAPSPSPSPSHPAHPPRPSLAQPRRAPAPARAPTPPRLVSEPVIVDIGTLLYRGESALRRAQQLREEARGATGEHLRALVDEVCDLVALAHESGS
jgi:chemotaxis protein histidine kinase CheA